MFGGRSWEKKTPERWHSAGDIGGKGPGIRESQGKRSSQETWLYCWRSHGQWNWAHHPRWWIRRSSKDCSGFNWTADSFCALETVVTHLLIKKQETFPWKAVVIKPTSSTLSIPLQNKKWKPDLILLKKSCLKAANFVRKSQTQDTISNENQLSKLIGWWWTEKESTWAMKTILTTEDIKSCKHSRWNSAYWNFNVHFFKIKETKVYFKRKN